MKTVILSRVAFFGCLLICILVFTSCSKPQITSSTSVPTISPSVTATETSLPPGVFSPGQIDSSMAGQAVKVQGKVEFFVLNPGGNGGAYVKLTGGGREIGLRIEPDDWDTFSAEDKAKYTEGNMVTAEGLLVFANEKLVIVYSVSPPATGIPQDNATFIVKVPDNTQVSYAVFMELVNEQGKSIGFVKMEQQGAVTWKVSLPSGLQKFGYRYTRDGIGFPTAEEFIPDSKDTYRWPDFSKGLVINDIVTKWRWVPEPGYVIPAVPSEAGTYNIVNRINNEEFQCGYQFVDFWWSPFHDLVYGTSLAMKQAKGGWVKIAPPIGFSQIEPLPVMNWEVVQNNPIYPEGELEYHIAQAQKAGLNVLLNPQYGILDQALAMDGNKQYSGEWWEAFYDEVERFSIYFADLAERCGVKYLIIADLEIWNSPNAPSNIREKYAEHIAAIRQHYSGKLGMAWLVNTYDPPEEIYPVGFYPELFDFFAIGGPAKLADDSEPGIAEIKTNFKAILEAAVEPLYSQYRKPVIMYSVGFPSLDGAAMHDFIHDDPPMDVYEPYSDKYRLDLEEQALIYEAMMQVVAEKPYITGFYPFNSHWPTPLPASKLYTVWGKPAEQVLAGWYERFALLNR